MTGDTGHLPYDLKTNIRICGLSHISAVSGLHIGILASVLLMILQKIKVRNRLSYLLVLIPIWLFVLIVGIPYSTVRSAFMFSVMAVGIGLFQHSDPFSSLFGSLMLCGLVSPFCALDVGLLSSASATFGLLLFVKPFNDWMMLKIPAKLRKKKIAKYIIGSVAQTTSAVAGLIPCMLIFYKNFSVVVVVSNLLVLPLVTVLLGCSLFGGLFSFAPVIANPFLLVSGITSKIIILICNTLAKIPFAEISVSRGYLIVALCGVLILFMVAMVLFTLNRGGRRLRSLLLVFSILCFVVSAVSFNIFNRNNLEIYIPDDGESVSALVIYKGETTLICGDMQYTLPSKIYSTLRSVGYNKIDNLVTQEEISRTLLERISGKVKVEKYVVHKEIEDIFPRVMAKNGEISFVEKSFTTSKGVRVDFDRNRSEVLVSVGDFSALILNRGLDFDSPVFRDASVVVTREASVNKLKDVSYYDVVCSCNENDREEVMRYFDENNIDGVLTAGYGGIRVWASAKGGYSLLRTE
ncbi:MAG: ComEC/Rec2 family competence protein, partial [Clostridia bacterium]|nr:ComEC/Rec2 family competence protein [Clostridia bacterium]